MDGTSPKIGVLHSAIDILLQLWTIPPVNNWPVATKNGSLFVVSGNTRIIAFGITPRLGIYFLSSNG